ncbi:MAG: hypothetical protein AVDCRST_MAG66-4637 [uncultured Pseudonocardia sp.]|uniref:Uncharacterized protein n=1 Tax=uncultured Pseudonocardia sp. TaxID=211455 RepID=A0A6J4QLD8_9PSEU|nr:MAG: hypothetical protein AVDCRST_MAG66-4637 [uncultured Pseudonocardia sp.]
MPTPHVLARSADRPTPRRRSTGRRRSPRTALDRSRGRLAPAAPGPLVDDPPGPRPDGDQW